MHFAICVGRLVIIATRNGPGRMKMYTERIDSQAYNSIFHLRPFTGPGEVLVGFYSTHNRKKTGRFEVSLNINNTDDISDLVGHFGFIPGVDDDEDDDDDNS